MATNFNAGYWYKLNVINFYNATISSNFNVEVTDLYFSIGGHWVNKNNIGKLRFATFTTAHNLNITCTSSGTGTVLAGTFYTTSQYLRFDYCYFKVKTSVSVPLSLQSSFDVMQMPKPLVSIYNANTAIWVDLPCPSDYYGTSTTAVDSARNASGKIKAKVVISDLAKVEMKWNFLTVEEYKTIAQLFEPNYNGSFFNAVSFFDSVKGNWNGNANYTPTNSAGTNPCKMFYCGDRKVQVAKTVLNNDGSPKGYSGVSLNLIDTGYYYGEQE